MNETERQRYSRQIVLPHIGEAGQQRLLDARVMVVGLGGLGSPVAMYLAAAGVGTLVLVDFDRVELSNLQRQIIHGQADVNRLKVESAAATIAGLNGDTRVETVPRALDDEELLEAARSCRVVVDASDNFETRYALNRACMAAGVPLVSGAATAWDGQVAVFDPRRDGGPCYHCLYPDDGGPGETCDQAGIFAPLLGMVGSIQAAEVLKLIMDTGETLAGRLMLMDALGMNVRILAVPRDPGCRVCGAPASKTCRRHPNSPPSPGRGVG